MKGNFRAQPRRGDRGDGEAEPGPGHAIFAAAKESLADTGKVYFVHAGAFIGHDKPFAIGHSIPMHLTPALHMHDGILMQIA